MKKIPPMDKLIKICRRDESNTPRVYRDFLNVIYRGTSIHVTKLLLNTAVTPNQITVIGIFSSILGGIFFSIGQLWSFVIGTFFFFLFFILDRVDGEIARYKKLASCRGKYLSQFAHYITEVSMDLGLILGTYTILQENIVLLFGFIMFLFGVLIKFTVSANLEMLYYAKKFQIDGDKRLNKGIGGEINTLIFSFLFFPFWILIAAVLDNIIPKIFIPFGSFLMLLVVFYVFVRGFKFLGTVIYYYFKN